MEKKMLPKALAALVGFGVVACAVNAEVITAIGASEKYTDNVYRQKGGDQKQSSWITSVKPSVELQLKNGGSKYELGANTEAGYYSVDTRNNYVDWSGYGKADLEFNTRNHLQGKLAQTHSHDEIGQGRTEGAVAWKTAVKPDEVDEFDRTDASLKYVYGATTSRGRLALEDIYMAKQYSNNRALTSPFDYKDNEYRATAFLRVMPKTSVLLEGRSKEIRYDKNTLQDSDEKRIYAGAEWEATAKTTGSVRVGKMTKESSNAASTLPDYDKYSWEIGAKWKPYKRSTFALDTSRGAVESSSGGAYVDRAKYRLSWLNDWSTRVSSRAYIEKQKDQYLPSVPLRRDTTYIVGVGTNYKLNKWVNLAADYTHEDRNSSYNEKQFVRNMLIFSGDMKFK
ncbi:MAG TPA: outer membrane beta-barrel protein [Pseudomonadales bacterium]|nr:outer membrane beta-barrel protein [Pseudomonadales bacterium]